MSSSARRDSSSSLMSISSLQSSTGRPSRLNKYHCAVRRGFWDVLFDISHVTIIEIDITIFSKVERNRYCDFWSNCESIMIPYCPETTGDRHRRSQDAFYILRVRSRRVWRSLYLQLQILGLKNQSWIDIEFFIKKLNRCRVQRKKNTIMTSLFDNADGFLATAVVIVHHAPTCCSSDRPVIFQSKYTKFYFEKSIYMISYNF